MVLGFFGPLDSNSIGSVGVWLKLIWNGMEVMCLCLNFCRLSHFGCHGFGLDYLGFGVVYCWIRSCGLGCYYSVVCHEIVSRYWGWGGASLIVVSVVHFDWML